MSSYSGLPANQTLGPDHDGVITQITHRRNEDGQVIRVTRRLRQSKIKESVRPQVLARRKWAKFGRAVRDPPDITVRDIEEHTLDLFNKNRDEEKQEDLGSKIAGNEGSIVVCRNCGESGHWTRSCTNPAKTAEKPSGLEDLGLGSDVLGKILGNSDKDAAASAGPDSAAADSAEADSSASSSGKYIPRHKLTGGARDGPGGRDSRQDLTTIRISNLPETVTDYIVQDLVRQFGPTTRVFVAKDDMGKCRGFAYVSYTHPDDAQMALKRLSGKGLLNHILRVEIAPPRADSDRDRDRRAFAAAAAHQPSARGVRAPWRQ